MTIRTIIDFYFSQYETIEIKGEYDKGISGKFYTYTKKEFLETWDEWLDEEVVIVNFQTHYAYKKTVLDKMEIPKLYFLYKN